jgi:hypothetical protein
LAWFPFVADVLAISFTTPSPAGEGWGEENKNKKNYFRFPLILTFSLKGEGT